MLILHSPIKAEEEGTPDCLDPQQRLQVSDLKSLFDVYLDFIIGPEHIPQS